MLLLILVMLPFWTSYLIRTYAWMIILGDNGVINWGLESLGVISDPIPMLNTDFSVILGMTYGFLPFAILPLFVSIDRMDHNLVQAARDLYANGRAAFLHVTLPRDDARASSRPRSSRSSRRSATTSRPTCWAAPRRRPSPRSSRCCSPAGATGRTAPRSASC